MRIALVEDDPAQAELVTSWLRGAGHECHWFERGTAFLTMLGRESFDLLVLDWALPDMEGDEVLQRVRERLDWPIPVLFLTSRDSEEDIVHALELGADDFLGKPARERETLARVAALARRALPTESPETTVEFAPYTFDLKAREVSTADAVVSFTQKEFELALFLFRNAGRLLSRGHILEMVWSTRPDLNTRTIDTHVSRVRSKLKLSPANGWRLSSVYQHGYRLERIESESASGSA